MPMIDFARYCKSQKKDWYAEALSIDSESIYKMLIVDYLISNGDRHSMNWGFMYNCNTMKILGCHPLFDHNAAFDERVMNDAAINTKFGAKHWTLEESAKMAIKEVDFYFKKKFAQTDFMNSAQFRSFMSKANNLGIKVREDG